MSGSRLTAENLKKIGNSRELVYRRRNKAKNGTTHNQTHAAVGVLKTAKVKGSPTTPPKNNQEAESNQKKAART